MLISDPLPVRLPAALLLVALAPLPAVAGENADPAPLNGNGWSVPARLLYNDDPRTFPGLIPDSAALPGSSLERWLDGRAGSGRALLWRDPDHGLVRTIASYLEYGPEQHYRLGAEGQLFLGPFTAIGRAGYLTSTATWNEPVPQHYAGMDLRWYATDNLSLEIGGEQLDDAALARVSLEYQPSQPMLRGFSFFAQAAHGGMDSEYILGGFRYSFGANPSLILRDRGDAALLERLSPRFPSLQPR
jgi:hypothetical protein